MGSFMSHLWHNAAWWLPILVIILVVLAYKLLQKVPLSGLDKRAVFITGCDGVFGGMLVHRLLRRRMVVFAGCFTQEGADRLRKEAAADTDGSLLPHLLHIVFIDVRSTESCRQAAFAVDKAVRTLGNGVYLWALMNNAGILGRAGVDEWLNVDDYISVMDVNLFGVIRVTHAFRYLLNLHKGRVIIMSSLCGRFALSGVDPYNVSKYAVEGYADTLRAEATDTYVSVHVIEPMQYKSKGLLDGDLVMRSFDEAYIAAPAHVQLEYGTDYLRDAKAAYRRLMRFTISKKLSNVLDAMEQSVVGRFAKKRYFVGWYTWFPVMIGACLVPTCFSHVVLEYFYKPVFMRTPHPSMRRSRLLLDTEGADIEPVDSWRHCGDGDTIASANCL